MAVVFVVGMKSAQFQAQTSAMAVTSLKHGYFDKSKGSVAPPDAKLHLYDYPFFSLVLSHINIDATL